ncbi:acyltransferase [Citrobacter sp. MNAZ 1397]|uniref:acyltransferase family protein n=1 Tax=Citrobacter sp. MNAZ 1397 TaxID=2911205 RepID=UPI00202600E5|nr:acyltransferase [Citrobacter sp. MNAZ 1397]MCL9671707.1 acyltransferase [Citrobacter sp. MNAZ 1397]
MENKITNHNIQALRALAILLVIIQHLHRLPVPEWLMSTYSSASYWGGVDIFLAISGFLMCKSLDNEIRKHGRTHTAFYYFFMKRVFRLIPALLTWAIICIFIAYLISPYGNAGIDKSINTFIYSLLGVSNIYYFNETTLGHPYDPLLSVTWSLSLEWQLYLVLSLLAIVLKKPFFCLSLIAVIIFSSIFLPNGVNHQETIGWWIRPQAFFLGSLLYLLNHLIKKIVINKFLNLLLGCTAVYSLVFYTSLVSPTYKLAYVGILGAAIFMLVAINMPPFKSRYLDWIGDRSYSIYLCHIPVMIITRLSLDHLLSGSIFAGSSILYIAVFCLITAIFSNASYKYIEQPFINFYRRKEVTK